MPFFSLLIFFLLALFFMALIQVHIFEIAFEKLGLTPEISLMILVGTLIGSGINLPVYSLRTKITGHWVGTPGRRPVWEILQPVKEGQVVIALNVGGCVIPVGLSLYFVAQHLLDPFKLALALAAVTAICFRFSRLIPGMGVAMPIFIAPLASAAIALLLDVNHAAQLAYVSGVLGVLIGADLLRLKNIASLGAPVAAIGGAGTFDGIFMTGIIAALLA
ncbi:MAG: DUF1614 domain-containing protein [Gammaproteobacteria bacterium]